MNFLLYLDFQRNRKKERDEGDDEGIIKKDWAKNRSSPPHCTRPELRIIFISLSIISAAAVERACHRFNAMYVFCFGHT